MAPFPLIVRFPESSRELPVIANECIVRAFYFIRRLINEIKEMSVSSISDIVSIDWNKVKPYDSPTLTRMLTVATAVFTAIDITDAIASKKYFVAVNFVGLGRCAVSLESEMKNFLKIRDVKRIRTMYEDIRLNTYTYKDGEAYGRMEECMDLHKFGLTLEQTEILYNLERYKIIDDINKASKIVNNKKAKELKSKWFEEWQRYMEKGFADFTGVKDAKLEWYTTASLIDKVKQNNPKGTWFRLVLLEAMIFEPYYALSLVTDKDGKKVPSTEYDELKYDNSDGDQFLDNFFPDSLGVKGYVKRLRKCYDKMLNELSEVLKMRLTRLKITAIITLAIVTTAGMFAPAIAVALVGSNFAGLSGAALINACLAYIGGGAVAAGGFGMAGGTMVIVGGGAALGLGVGAGVGNAVSAMGFVDKRMTILQSAKLMTAVREIFLKDEHDTELSESVFEQYIENTKKMEHQLIEMKYQVYDLEEKERKALEEKIKNAEGAINAMQIALKSMEEYSSKFMLKMESNMENN